jgi:glycosyltransferase involved in cell wall biosynthesis
MTDPLGQSQVLPYITNLSKKNYKFHLISFEKPDRYSKYNSSIEKICFENKIKWYPLKYNKKPPFFSSIFDFFKMRKLSKELNVKHSFSLIHCRSYIPSLVGLRFKRMYGIPFLFDMRGFWADERVDGELWNLKNPIFKIVYNYFKNKEKQFLIHSDHTISLTYNGKNELLLNQDKNDYAPISVIPCCADTSLFEIKKRTTGQFTIGYLGSLGTWYMLDEMLVFFKRILEIYPEALFHFLTKEPASLIYDKAKELDISSSHFLIEESSRNNIPIKTKNWNFSFIFITPSYSKKFSSPTKQGELMAMGIPIICNEGVGDMDEIVIKFNSGVIVSTNEIANLNIQDIIRKTFEKEQIRKGGIEYFSLKKGVKMYLEIYDKLLNKTLVTNK